MFYQPAGSRCQTFFGALNKNVTDVHDEHGNLIFELQATDFTIKGNTIVNAQVNAISLHNVTGFEVSDNILLANQEGLTRQEYPGIFLKNSEDGSIDGNTLIPRWDFIDNETVNLSNADLAAANITLGTVSPNIVLSTAPAHPDYFIPYLQTELDNISTLWNEAPVLQAESVTVFEGDGLVVGQMLATDADDDAELTFSTGSAPAGFAMAEDGSWSLDTNDLAYAALAPGALLTVDVDVTVTDDRNASDTQFLTLTVEGTRHLIEGTTGDDVLKSTDATVNQDGAFLNGDAGDDQIFDTNADDILLGAAGADQFVIDYRQATVSEAESILDLNFSDGDVLRILTGVAGTFDNSLDPNNNMTVAADGSSVFIRDLEDLAEVNASSQVQMANNANGDGLVITFAQIADHSIELMGFTEDLLL